MPGPRFRRTRVVTAKAESFTTSLELRRTFSDRRSPPGPFLTVPGLAPARAQLSLLL